ncbi:MAG: FHA domain-containing protein [Verrucomicrobiales bacterium]|nr:FHA domain-containing protein [Verrucomicrobiales bacterium]
MASIQYTTPEGATGEIELTAEQMSVGRADDNMIVIPDGSVSSHHGELLLTESGWLFNDLGSTNGSKVNGEQVMQIPLASGMSFVLGSVDCVFVGDVTPQETAAAYAAGAAAVPTSGYGAIACDASARTGYGPKKKEKGGSSAGLMVLGVLALLACGAAVFLFSSLSA